MHTLATGISQTLFLLGGATAGHATLVDDAVGNRLCWIESQLLRHRSQESDRIRRENTRDSRYPVPDDHLPTSGPIAFPPPPGGMLCLPFLALFAAVDGHLHEEFRRFQHVPSFAIQESQTLRQLRRTRALCKAALKSFLPAPHIIPNPSASPPHPEEPMDLFPTVVRAPTDVWRLYENDRDVKHLELFAPLHNKRTERLPAFAINSLILHMQRAAVWKKPLTVATLHMLASPLIVSLTFDYPPSFIIEMFITQDGSSTSLRYTFDGSSASATISLPDGRRIMFTNVDAAAESALLSPTSLARVRTLVLSNRLRPTAAACVWRAAPAALTSLTIEFDRRAVGWPHAALVAYRGAGWACPRLASMRLAAVPECDGIVDVRMADLRPFMAAAFPHISDVVFERIRVLD